MGVGAKCFGILMEEFVDYFNVPVAVAASAMGVAGGMYTIAAPMCIAAGQHFTQRKVVMLGGLIGGIGLALCGLLFSIEWVILMFGCLYGFGNACLFGNGLVMLGQYFKKRRGLANGLALSGASIGQFALPPLLQFLLDTYTLKKQPKKLQGPETDKLLDSKTGEDIKITLTKHKANGDDISETKGNIEDGKVDDGANGELRSRYFDSKQESIVFGSVDSLHTVAVETDMKTESNDTNNEHEKKNKENKCISFLCGLIDFSVLKSDVVILLVIVSFLIFFGVFNFIIFMPASAANKGYSKYDKAILVSISGVCDLIGRVLVGVAGDFELVARYKILATASLLNGFAILGFGFASQYEVMALFVGFYGFLGGCYVSINAPVVIDLVGLQSMPKVLGVLLFIQGLGAAIGQPVLGAIRDAHGSYLPVNIICSLCAITGSLLLYMYPIVRRREEKRAEQKPEFEITLELH
ncbi:MOT12-like protein [Mya arenaria]|uniref:MOT12-like protein n=1 Tax=Mya arenaria TaxID=6604 RepID=A0ABY7G372_MYAAR|nr:MOT12-like protein [Mya arenaria]